MGFVSKIVDQVTNVVEHVLDDPLQAIVTVGAMAMGIPPVFAGAIGGAAGAAEHGGNILEGAAIGGLTGYVGGAAGGAAAEAGAGQILSSAAGGAAAGATGAALTGGDIVGGALTGGVMGGGSGAIASYFNPQTGNSTYTYDDGSTITKNASGSVVTSTPSNQYGLGAPVVDLSTGGTPTTTSGTTPVSDTGITTGPVRPPVDLKSTGYSDSSAGTVYNGPNGQEVVLNSGKTVLLSDYEAAIQSGKPISIDGNMTTGATVEMSGIPRSTENPGTGKLPDGTELASVHEGDGAKWNEESQMYVNPTTGAYFDNETNAWVRPAGSVAPTGDTGGVPSSYVAPVTVNADGSTTTVNYNGSITTAYADGTTVISNPDGTSVTKDTAGHTTVGDGKTTTGTPGTGTPGTSGPTVGPGANGDYTYKYDDGSTVTIHTNGTVTSTPSTDTPYVAPTTTTTTETPVTTPAPVVETPPVVTPTEVVDPYNPNAWTPTPVTPIFPIVVPKTPVTPTTPTPTYETVGPGDFTKLQVPTGLNPGMMAPTPYYQTSSPVQSQYFWGSHNYQTGPEFNSQQYNSAPGAPATPWGLQQMGDVARPQDIVDYINSPQYQAQFVSGPVAPVRG